MSRTIVVMIDGLGADYFTKYRHRLPHLNSIAERGTYVERISPERCATSLPGRTSIVTGVSSAEHGIYGNVIWDGERFRYANSSDVQAPTIAEQAHCAGLCVANIGYAMLKPEHSSLYYPAAWSHELLQANEDGSPTVHDQVWIEQMQLADKAQWLKPLIEQGYPSAFVSRDYEHPTEYLLSGQMNDQISADWAQGIACTRSDVDFIIIEIGMPDYFLHRYGCEHDLTRLAIETADGQIGRLLHGLDQAGLSEEFNLLITSDHGFSDVEQSIHPEHILSDTLFSCEGGILHLHYENEAHLQLCSEQLAAYSAVRIDNSYLPTTDRNQIAAFAAPDNCDFYLDKHHCRQAMGPAHYKANHGFKSGHVADERFLVMAGPDISKDKLAFAQAEQVAPTIAKLLDLDASTYPMPAI